MFIDSNVRSFKMCLIFNRDSAEDPVRPVIPLLYSSRRYTDPNSTGGLQATGLQETYEDLATALKLVEYELHRWKVVCDFKVLNKLLGLNGSWCAEPCLFCRWRSRATVDQHYAKIGTWKKRKVVDDRLVKDKVSVLFACQIPVSKVLLPTLHIKLGVMSQFVKSLFPYEKNVGSTTVKRSGNANAINFLQDFFLEKTDDKIKAGTFTGPDIRRLMKSSVFPKKLKRQEKKAWSAFCDLCVNFFGNKKAANYRQMINNLRKAFEDNHVLMSLKTHILFEHPECFPVSCGGYGEEQGENLHQETSVFERRFKDKTESMIVNYAYSKVLEGEIKLARKPKNSKRFFNRTV